MNDRLTPESKTAEAEGQQAITLDTRRDINLANFENVAWHRGRAVFSDASRERMATARTQFEQLLEQPDVVIYGVTTGYGQMAGYRLSGDERRQHAARPPHANRVTFGPDLPERVKRGIVFARLTNYVEGHAAITPALAEAVAGLLAGTELPHVPVEGNGGAGEILALGALLGPLAERTELREKDMLALINGSPCAAALLADAVLVARRRLEWIEAVFALAWEAFYTPLDHLDPALAELWGDADQAAALATLREWVAGGSEQRRPYQAPVSFRILPRMLGRLRRGLRQAEEAATLSLQAITDNPVYLQPDAEHPHGRVLSNGGFHNTHATPAMDELAAAYADLCTLAERQSTKILSGAVSHLADQLREQPDDPRYLGCQPMAQVGFGEAARRAAQRTFLPGSESGGFGQNDVATNHFFAWQAQAEAGRCLESSLAALATIASQALYITQRPAPPALEDHLTLIRERVPVLEGDVMRPLGPELEGLAEAIRQSIFGGERS